MNLLHLLLTLLLGLACTSAAQAGIYLSTDPLTPDSDPRAFLDQLRKLRGYGPPDVTMQGRPTEQRKDFLAKVATLRAKPRLTPDEQADLGGYLLYLKQTSTRHLPFAEAIAVLEPAARAHPQHFALAANLGTAYQLAGRLDAAQRSLEAAVELADPARRPVEHLQLRLVQQRLRESASRGRQPDLDPLFGRPTDPSRFADATGVWYYGRLAPTEIAKLPNGSVEEAVRQVQTLLVWLPDDGRLLWQFGEWGLVLGKKAVALEVFNSAVDTFRLSHPALKQHRQRLQESLHWGTLAERLGGDGKEQKAEQWVIRILGESLAQASPGAGPAGTLQLLKDCVVEAEKPNLGALFDQPNAAEPTGKPFVLQPWHWVLIIGGAVLAVLLVLWQIQQLFRPRRAA